MIVCHIINPPLTQITNQCFPRHHLLPNTNPNPNLSSLPPSSSRSRRTLRQPSPHRHRLASFVPPTRGNSPRTSGSTRIHAHPFMRICHAPREKCRHHCCAHAGTPPPPGRAPGAQTCHFRVTVNPAVASSSSPLHLLQLLSHLYLLQLLSILEFVQVSSHQNCVHLHSRRRQPPFFFSFTMRKPQPLMQRRATIHGPWVGNHKYCICGCNACLAQFAP